MNDTDDLEGTIWLSEFLARTETLPYRNNLSRDDHPNPSMLWAKNVMGIPQGPEDFATEFYWDIQNRKAKTPKHTLRCGNYIISESIARVFQSFDLGKTQFYPTKFFEFDQTTPIPGKYFCPSFGETKEGVIIDKSRRIDRSGVGSNRPTVPMHASDGDLTLHRSALDGIDLWIDSNVDRSLFLTGRVVAALRTAKLDKYFFLTKCIVLDE